MGHRLGKGLRLLLAGLPLLWATSCSQNEEPETPQGMMPDKFYITLSTSIFTEAETRSQTQTDGGSGATLDGTANETALTSADLYFWDPSEKKVVLYFKAVKPLEESPYTLRTEVSMAQMRQLAGKKLQLFVIGNPAYVGSPSLTDRYPEIATFRISGLNSIPLGDFGSTGLTMPLVNASKYEIDFSKVKNDDENELLKLISSLFNSDNILELSKAHETITTPGKSLDLERAVARIDYNDMRGNLEKEEYNVNVYPLADVDNHTLKLVKMQLFNVNSEAYLFRHTSEGTPISADLSKIVIFGTERGDDANKYVWIAGSDWSALGKKSTFLNKLSVTDKVFSITTQPGATTDTEKGIISLTTLNSRTKPKGSDYFPWCYVSENTIPKGSLMTEENLRSNATGIAFTFQICEDKKGEKPVEKQGTSEEGDPLTLTMSATQKWQDVKYDKENRGYFLTYYAYIVHNNGNDVTEIIKGNDGEEDVVNTYPAPMKYGVVRNNVYQLSVKSISDLPDPQNPKTMYLAVDIKVLPWVLRQQEITF